MTSHRFDGKVALITGGGSGIGAASALRIASEGGKVVVMGRREQPLDAVAQLCGGLAVQGDTALLEDLQHAVSVAEDNFGGLDILITSAGIETFGSVETIALDDWQRLLDVNLNGTMLAARAAIPAMRRRLGGAVVLVGSVAALRGAPSFAAYLTAKAGLLGLNRSLAFDFGPEKIRCNALCPGWVLTEMADRTLQDLAAMKGISRDELVATMVRPFPLRRMSQPEEMAGAVAFLASDDASFVTGTTLVADGGATAVDAGTLQFF